MVEEKEVAELRRLDDFFTRKTHQAGMKERKVCSIDQKADEMHALGDFRIEFYSIYHFFP